MSPLWTDTRTEYLRSLYDGHKLNCREMAAELSFRYDTTITRNAVIGKLKRLGLQGGGTGHGGPRPGAGPPSKRRAVHGGLSVRGATFNPPYVGQPAMEKTNQPETPPPASALQCSILDLTNETCRFPVTDDSPWLFCGAPEADLNTGVPYCPYHSQLAYDRRRDRGRSPTVLPPVAEPSRTA